MSAVVEIHPKHPCDRCLHTSAQHFGPEQNSRCKMVGSRPWHGKVVPHGMKAHQCPCDGYFPKPGWGPS